MALDIWDFEFVISGPIPLVLGGFLALERIVLDNNGLTGPLPGSAVGNLLNLRHLDLHSNALTGLLIFVGIGICIGIGISFGICIGIGISIGICIGIGISIGVGIGFAFVFLFESLFDHPFVQQHMFKGVIRLQPSQRIAQTGNVERKNAFLSFFQMLTCHTPLAASHTYMSHQMQIELAQLPQCSNIQTAIVCQF